MKEALIVNLSGEIIDVELVDDNAPEITNILEDDESIGYSITKRVPEGFHIPKWDGTEWTEGKDLNEILNQLKKAKIENIDSLCNTEILSGFKSLASGTENEYGFSYEDQQNLTGMLTLFNSNPALTEVNWKTKNNGLVVHTKDQFVTLCTDSFAHKQSKIEKFWNLKTQVESATTVTEINAIQWDEPTAPVEAPVEPTPAEPTEPTPAV